MKLMERMQARNPIQFSSQSKNKGIFKISYGENQVVTGHIEQFVSFLRIYTNKSTCDLNTNCIQSIEFSPSGNAKRSFWSRMFYLFPLYDNELIANVIVDNESIPVEERAIRGPSPMFNRPLVIISDGSKLKIEPETITRIEKTGSVQTTYSEPTVIPVHSSGSEHYSFSQSLYNSKIRQLVITGSLIIILASILIFYL